MNKKHIISLCFISSLIGLLLGAYVQAQTTTTFTISSGVYPNADFTIWRSGSTYYAKNAYGYISYSGTNASTLINNVLGNGGNILLKEGVYDIDANLVVSMENTTFRGEGRGSLLRCDSTSTQYGILIQADYPVICDLAVSNTQEFGITCDYDTIGALITRNYVSDTLLDGIHFRQSWNCTASFNIVENTGDDAIAFIWGGGNKAIGNHIYRSNAVGTSGNAIYMGGERNGLIEGNTIEHIPRYGICVDQFGSGNISRQITIEGNTIRYAGSTNVGGLPYGGIILNYANQCVVDSNTIEQSYWHGIRAYNATYCVISNNVVMDNDQNDTSGASGIVLEYYSTWNIVSGNQANDYQATATQNYGIVELGAGNDYNLIIGCITRGNTVANILIAGTNTECHSCFNGTTYIT